jgi:hypothetical protein
MSDPYVAARIREALVAAEGSRARARRILLGWVQEDDRLLRGLAAPFLKAIVTGAVERATRPRAPAPASAAAEVPRRELSPEALDLVLSQMGRRQPGAAAPRPASGPATAQRGEALAGLKLGTVNVPPPTKAGDAHVRTIKALAQLYKRSRDV